MKRSLIYSIVPAVAALFIAGCSSAPSKFYTLNSTAEKSADVAVTSCWPPKMGEMNPDANGKMAAKPTMALL